MHRSEGEVHANDREPEIDSSQTLVEHLSEHLRPPVVHACKQPEHGTTKDDVVEVSDDVIRVGLLSVRWCNRVRDTGETTDGELHDDANGVQHRHSESQFSAPHGEGPVDDLHTGRNAIAMVATEKAATEIGPRPEANMGEPRRPNRQSR